MSVGTIYRTTVSCVPDADLSLNARVHHMARARKARALREFVGWQTREDAPPEPFAVPVLLTTLLLVIAMWFTFMALRDIDVRLERAS